MPPCSQADAAAIARIPTSRYKSYELERAMPPTDVVQSLARAWKIPAEWFWDGKNDRPPSVVREHPDRVYEVEPRNKVERLMTIGDRVAIPVWRGALLGSDEEDHFDEDDGQPMEFAAFYTLGDPDRHVVCIPKGNSMQPRILSYARVLVRLDPDVPPGHLVAAQKPTGAIYIKRFIRGSDGRVELHSVNTEYPPIDELDDWIIRGGVVLIQHDPAPGTANIEWAEGRYLRA